MLMPRTFHFAKQNLQSFQKDYQFRATSMCLLR